jgi:hypothetical protein
LALLNRLQKQVEPYTLPWLDCYVDQCSYIIVGIIFSAYSITALHRFCRVSLL